MISLFIDTSKTSLSLGLMSGNKLIFKENTESYNKHSNYLINKIVNALKRNNLEIKDIDNFIILNGPGSFTGIRIGVTVMKTLAWSLNKKLYMLSNLKALELHSKENVDIKLSIIDDKKDSFYMGIYSDNEKEEYISLDDIPKYKNKKIELISNDVDITNKIYDILSKDNEVYKTIPDHFDYERVIEYALSCKDVNVHLAKPLYIKKIDAEK